MESKKYKLSAQKYQELSTELEVLETKGRQEIADSLQLLRSETNTAEDAFFSDVLDDKRFLEKRIAEIKEILDSSEIVEGDDISTNKVDVGCTVSVGYEGFEDEYTIVSPPEADPTVKKISDESPVGKALVGAKVGDMISVQLGVVTKEFRILKIKK